MSKSPPVSDMAAVINGGGEVRLKENKGMRFGRLALLSLLLCYLLALALPAIGTAATDIPVKIGVLAIRGKEQCLKSWQATADYLSSSIPGSSFVIVPLSHTEINSTVEKGEVDFILTNSSSYVELEYLYGANRIATLKERRLGRTYSKYGSVIFCRRDRSDIRQSHRPERQGLHGGIGNISGRLADDLARAVGKRHRSLPGFPGPAFRRDP